MAARILRLLEALLPRHVGPALAGDLAEMWEERRARGEGLRAWVWLVREAAGAVWRYRGPGRGSPGRRGGGAGIGMDLRVALRRLRRAPVHGAAVVATIALGVGVNSAVFSLVDGVLLEPLPYPAAVRIVQLGETHPEVSIPPGFASLPNFLDWQERTRSFGALALFRGGSVSITVERGPVYGYGATVTAEFFDVFGVEPLLGRTFTPEEAVEGGPPVAILGHGLWLRGYGGDEGVLGSALEVNGEPHVIVGVMPRGFEAHGDWIGRGVDLWRPFPVSSEIGRADRSWHVAGRLREGVDPEDARDDLRSVQAGLRTDFPDANAGWDVTLRPWSEAVIGDAARTLWLLLGTSTLVLLIACANVANLTLERTLGRREELATRTALGAGRGGVRRLVLVENLVVALLGGALGALLADRALALLVATEADVLPRLEGAGMDWSVLAFTFLVVIGVAVGLTLVALPGAAPGRPGAGPARGGASRRGRRGRRLAGTLAAVQLVLSFTLLVGAGLLVRSFQELRRVDLGFEPEGVTAATVALSWERVDRFADRVDFTQRVLDRLAASAGLESAGMINSLPLSGSAAQNRIRVPGITEEGREPLVHVRGISPGYAATMGIPVVEGRDLDAADVPSGGAVLVNRTLAERLWPGGSPVGQEVGFAGGSSTAPVVGVLGDVRHEGARLPPVPELYVPYSAEGLTSKSFVVRSELPAADVAARLREAVAAVDPDQPIREIRSMEEWVARSRSDLSLQYRLLGVAAGLATALAGIGLFAVLAALVQARSRDLAVRMAVGAGGKRILWLIFRRAAAVVLPSLALGWLGGLALGRTLGTVLYEVSPFEPGVFVAVSCFLVVVAALAVGMPARRAVALEPARILREE